MLRISKLTDYAILMMVELARDGEMLSAHTLADRVCVEIPTASKVLKLLWQRISVAVARALQEVSLAEMSAPMKITSNPLNITTLNAR